MQFEDSASLTNQIAEKFLPEQGQIELILLASDFQTHRHPRLRQVANQILQALKTQKPKLELTVLTPVAINRGDKETRVMIKGQTCKIEGHGFGEQVSTYYDGAINSLIENGKAQFEPINVIESKSPLPQRRAS